MKKIILFVFVFVFSVFFSSTDLMAKEMENNLQIRSSNEIKEIKPDKNKINENSKSSIKDIFGDEQTFPFVAGLGKNAAH